MPCGWEGNRGSGNALHGHASQISVVYPVAAHGLRKGDEHPAHTPHCFTFFYKNDVTLYTQACWILVGNVAGSELISTARSVNSAILIHTELWLRD